LYLIIMFFSHSPVKFLAGSKGREKSEGFRGHQSPHLFHLLLSVRPRLQHHPRHRRKRRRRRKTKKDKRRSPYLFNFFFCRTMPLSVGKREKGGEKKKKKKKKASYFNTSSAAPPPRLSILLQHDRKGRKGGGEKGEEGKKKKKGVIRLQESAILMFSESGEKLRTVFLSNYLISSRR